MKNLLFIALALIALSGCNKEEVVGPQGPQGSEGPQGNANVHALEVTFDFEDWTNICPEALDGFVCFEYEIDWEIIDEEMMDGGAVLVYQIGGTFGNTQVQLSAGSSVSFKYSIGEVELSAYGEAWDLYFDLPGVGLPEESVKFKLIAIAPKALELGNEHVQKLIAQELAK